MKVKLTPFGKKNLKQSRAWMNDRQLCRQFNRVYKPFSSADQRKWYRNFVKDKSQVLFAIEVDGIYVGNIGLKNIDRLNKKAEYHILIGNRDYWNKGVGTAATKKLLDYAKKLKLHKVYLHVNKSNRAALRLYEKTGFKKEGILKDELLREKKYVTIMRMAYFFHN